MNTPTLASIPTKEWVHARQHYIGGSEVSAVLGESPYKTPFQLWLLKTGRTEPMLSTPVTEFGHLFENVMAEKFYEKTGLKLRNISEPYEHPEHSFLRGNIDRQIVSSDRHNGPGVLEIKTTNSYRLKNEEGLYPKDWDYQIQHYLMLTGYEYGYIFFFERDTAVFHEPILVHRDEEFIRANTEAVVDWWTRHIIHDISPEPMTHEDMLILYPNAAEGSVVEASPKSYEDYKQLLNIRDKISEYQEHEEALKLQLKKKLGDSERIVLAGRDLVTWKNQTTNRVDLKALRKDHPDLCKQYINQTTTRRFTIK